MATEVNWSEKSSQNILHIYNYISFDSHFYAERFVTKLITSVEEQLSSQPLSGRNVPEFEGTRLSFLKEIVFRGSHNLQPNKLSGKNNSHCCPKCKNGCPEST